MTDETYDGKRPPYRTCFYCCLAVCVRILFTITMMSPNYSYMNGYNRQVIKESPTFLITGISDRRHRMQFYVVKQSLKRCRMTYKIVLLLLITLQQVRSKCLSSTFVATTNTQSVDYHHYSDNDNCIVNIIPNAIYQRGFYLEITWTRFHIEGDMPKCKDYVEVFLTR